MEIELSQGYKAKVDSEDYERVSQHKWYAQVSRGRDAYAKRNVRIDTGRTSQGLSRFVMDAPKGMVVDHINGDTLDNRKENLRVCTNQENTRNRYRSWGKTGYKGVSLCHCGYRVRIKKGDKIVHIGVYPTPEEAALSYNRAAVEEYGEYARLNEVSVCN